MKKLSLVIIVCGVMWGCGQKKDSEPKISKEQVTINNIKKDIDPSQEFNKQQTREVFESICNYSEDMHSLIKDKSADMNSDTNVIPFFGSRSQPTNALHRSNDTLNKSALLKLATLKYISMKEARDLLSSNYKKLSANLSFNASVDEKTYLAYLATASTNSNNYILSFNSVFQLYSKMGSETPPPYYLGRLVYFLTEVEQSYGVDKLKYAEIFIEKFKAVRNLRDSSIYPHIIQFLNDPKTEVIQSADSVNNNELALQSVEYIKLSLALSASIEEVKDCVSQYKRKPFQFLIPGFYHNAEDEVLQSIELLSLERLTTNQGGKLGYLVFLL